MSKYIKNQEPSVQKYRFYIQTAFALMYIWIGVEFYSFIQYLETGGMQGSFNRPPGVEGFLPISALMSVYYFFISGQIHPVHPAGFFIFLAIVGVSFVFGKAFCSWFCPFGFLSELVGDFGDRIQKKLFKRVLKLPRVIDYLLRSIKYLLLAFFIYAIFFTMTAASLKYFLDSPYNIVSDVKMYYFFADISRFSLIVIGVLFVLSIVVRNFWCRYLCPYGALLGVIGFFSPNKIKRNTDTCIDCGICTKVCPSNIKVDKAKTVLSDECSFCLTCVDSCPVKDTLVIKPVIAKKFLPKKMVAFLVVILYILIIGYGVLSKNWGNNVSGQTYKEIYKNLDKIGHPTSTKEIEDLNKISETQQ